FRCSSGACAVGFGFAFAFCWASSGVARWEPSAALDGSWCFFFFFFFFFFLCWEELLSSTSELSACLACRLCCCSSLPLPRLTVPFEGGCDDCDRDCDWLPTLAPAFG